MSQEFQRPGGPGASLQTRCAQPWPWVHPHARLPVQRLLIMKQRSWNRFGASDHSRPPGRRSAAAPSPAKDGPCISASVRGDRSASWRIVAPIPGSFAGPGFFAPMRNAALMRWCLEHGLRIVQPMTLMTMGPYQEPNGAFLCSILY